MTRNELLSVRRAHREAILGACPDLHPEMSRRSHGWLRSTDPELDRELDHDLEEASAPPVEVRIGDFGTYVIIDAKTAARRTAERERRGR